MLINGYMCRGIGVVGKLVVATTNCWSRYYKERTLKESSDTMAGHFQPKKLILAERYGLMSRSQRPGQTLQDYYAELQKAAAASLRPKVEEKLQELVNNGTLTQVDHSEWATPLVVVPKPGGKVRICGDYKITINPQLDINQYPLPKPDDLFHMLNGGQKFS
ncbi:hypothetical protein COOONC_08826 [Cooperia oncophora]